MATGNDNAINFAQLSQFRHCQRCEAIATYQDRHIATRLAMTNFSQNLLKLMALRRTHRRVSANAWPRSKSASLKPLLNINGGGTTALANGGTVAKLQLACPGVLKVQPKNECARPLPSWINAKGRRRIQPRLTVPNRHSRRGKPSRVINTFLHYKRDFHGGVRATERITYTIAITVEACIGTISAASTQNLANNLRGIFFAPGSDWR